MRSFCRSWAVLCIFSLLALPACGGSGGGITPGGNPTPTPVPPSPSADCPSTGTLPVSSGRTAQSRAGYRGVSAGAAGAYVPGMLAVQYASSADVRGLEQGAQRFDGRRVADLQYAALGLRSRVIAVNPADEDAAIAHLKTLPGVRAVTRIAYRQRMSVAANDPFYQGEPGSTSPYYQTASTQGQWDMHVINLDGAWSAFGTAVTAAPIAVVDTGVDTSLAEMQNGKITRARCYVTYPTNSVQSTGPYVTDTDGHGTDVAGIADAATNNSFGFAGVAYDAPLLAYRIFPSDPPQGCEGSNPPAQCNADTADEAAAINDAVAHGAKVINLSLGGPPPCSTSDPEYLAVENAIKSNVVVVAAAGNGDSSGNGLAELYCPAADPGVIAVGASALFDTALSYQEKVASYSNYLTTKGTANGGAFLVAPGGDPQACESDKSCPQDHFHWIQNLYSTAAYDAAQDSSCTGLDAFGQTGDCNIYIAGTSQATPHVAGVVSLMLGIHPGLTPSQVAAVLCSNADDIGDAKEGCGRLDAQRAVTAAKNMP